jgi:hypothetical protein
MIWWAIGIVLASTIAQRLWAAYNHPYNVLGKQAAYMNWVANGFLNDKDGYKNILLRRGDHEAFISYKKCKVFLVKPANSEAFDDFIALERWLAETEKVGVSAELSKEDALYAYARMMNTLRVAPLESLLAEDFVYESQEVFSALEGRDAFLDYIRPKLETIRKAGATVFAEMGMVSAYGQYQPCVILAQYSKENLVGLVLAQVAAGKVSRLDLCVVPQPKSAQRSGVYPE